MERKRGDVWGKRAFAGQKSQGFKKSEREGENRTEIQPWLLLALTELHLHSPGSGEGSVPGGWEDVSDTTGGHHIPAESWGEDAQHQSMDVEEGRSKNQS